MWTPEIKNKLLETNGSVQKIPEIPEDIKELYKTVWEVSQKKIIDLAQGRSPFIDQSQSLNIHMAEPTYSKISSMHFYAWKAGLKTGMYYLRSRPAADPIKFTVDVESLLKTAGEISVARVEDSDASEDKKDNEDNSEERAKNKRTKIDEGMEVKACPMRRKGAPVDEECLACGS